MRQMRGRYEQESMPGRTLSRRRLAAALSGAAVALPALAAIGCSAGAGRSEVRPSAGRQVTLTWLASRSGAEVPVWEGMARAAEQRYPVYKVEYVNSAENWTVKLPAMMAANTGPDIVRLEGNGFAELVGKSFFKDLSPYVQKDAAFNAKDFIPQSLDAFKVEGKHYAIPMVFSSIVMNYNTRLFAEAGVAPPADGWTWNDYV